MGDGVTVIDLYSPEPERPGARVTSLEPPEDQNVARASAAVAARNDEIIEILSDSDNDEHAPNGFMRRRRRKRQRRDGDPPPDSTKPGEGQLKDDGKHDQKRRAHEDPTRGNIQNSVQSNNVVDLSGDQPPPIVQHLPVSPEAQILEIYPDVDLFWLKGVLQSFNRKTDEVLHRMSEKGYTKAKGGNESLHQVRQADSISVAAISNEWSYDFMANDSFTPNSAYIKQAKSQLLCDFHFLTSSGADVILNKNGGHYAKAHDCIVTALKGNGDDETKFQRVNEVLSGRHPSASQAELLNAYDKEKFGVVFKRRASRKKRKLSVTDSILREEIKYVRGKLEEFLEIGRKRESIEKKKAAAQKSNTAVDCSCCFDGFDIDDMVACRREGHLFCVDCLKRYAEIQIFGVGNLGVDSETKKPAMELKCFQGECSSGFDRMTLEKALPRKTLEKYDEIQLNMSLQAAGMEFLETCPRCGFQAELPFDQKVFVCPVTTCKFESCRECGEPAHVGIRCDEVEKTEETKGRITVEEAISEAKIRKCPRCKKSFLKDEGCNKITCGCGLKICYLCRQTLKDYSHFCQTPHCRHDQCQKCPLWSTAEDDDKRLMLEAGKKAAAAVSAQNVHVDVEGILKTPPPACRL